MLRIVSTASTAWRSGQSLKGSRPFAAGSRKTRRRTRRPWPSSKASNTGRPPDPRPKARGVGAGPAPDPLGDALLAAPPVKGEDPPLEPQGVEQLGDGRDLVRLAV